MKKKKGALITLTLAGVIALSGAGGLHISMAKTMQEEKTAQIEQKEDIILEESTQAAVENQIWLEEEGIYLPEGAQIMGQCEVGYEIAWDDCTIRYGQDNIYCVKEEPEDLGLAKLMPILKNTIKQYSGQDMGKCELNVSLVKPDMEGNEFVTGAGAEDSFVLDKYVVEPVTEQKGVVRIYEFDNKCYQVQVNGIPQHQYSIWVDSVTGEVKAFFHEDESLGDFTNEKEAYALFENGLSEQESKEYEAIMESFISNDLKLGNVEKIYGQYFCEYSGNNTRVFYEALCKTDNGTIVEVSIDCGTKTVRSFNANVIYMLEEELK